MPKLVRIPTPLRKLTNSDDVVEVNADQFEQAPETVRTKVDGLVTGVYKLPARLLLILEVERTVDISARQADAA